jgi:N-acetylglutamate synthase-like GNAT family acetyltransferase
MISYAFLTLPDLQETDVPVIKSLVEQLVNHSVELDRGRIELILGRASLLIARNEEGRIVGMASLYRIPLFSRTVGRVEDVVVDANTRGQGVGRGLMEHLIEEAKHQGISRLFLTSRPDRIEANQLYQRLGFTIYETNPYKMDLS